MSEAKKETVKKLGLYLISQGENNDYDSFDSAVVAAKSEKAARETHPYADMMAPRDPWSESSVWCRSPKSVTVEFLGEAKREIKPGIVCASFNAG